jgi:hypothetical protein
MTAMQVLDVDPTGMAAAEGEVEAFQATIVGGWVKIAGSFRPGDALHLRRGLPVVVLGADEYRELITTPPDYCPDCEELQDEVSDQQGTIETLTRQNADLQRALEAREAQVLDLEGQLVDAQEQLDGMLQHPQT